MWTQDTEDTYSIKNIQSFLCECDILLLDDKERNNWATPDNLQLSRDQHLQSAHSTQFKDILGMKMIEADKLVMDQKSFQQADKQHHSAETLLLDDIVRKHPYTLSPSRSLASLCCQRAQQLQSWDNTLLPFHFLSPCMTQKRQILKTEM